jgi:hypothetical protein
LLILYIIIAIFILYIKSNLHKINKNVLEIIIKLVLLITIFIILFFTNFTYEYLDIGTPNTVDAEDWPMGHKIGHRYYCPLEYNKLQDTDGKIYLGNQLTEFRGWYCENVRTKAPRLGSIYLGDARTERLVLSMIRETDYIFSLNPPRLKNVTVSERLLDDLTDLWT